MKIIIILVIGFLSLPADAFINVESLRQGLETGFYGSSGLTLDGASGNVNTFKVGANTRNIYKVDDHEVIVSAGYNYGEATEVKNTNKGFGHLRYAEHIDSWWQWEVFAQLEFNEFQSLELRQLAGGGLRLALNKSEAGGLYLGIGAFYEDEQIRDDEDQANFRGNIYISYTNQFKKGFEAVSVIYLQPSYKRFDDFRLRVTFGIEIELLEKLTWVNTIRYAIDTKPPVSIRKEDLVYNVGFNFRY